MANPPPHESTLDEYGNRNRNRARLAIHNQPVTVNKFEVNPALLRELMEIHFSDKNNEDANRHLTNFSELCETVKMDDCSEEGKMLRLFPFSLKDDAKEWLNSFPAGKRFQVTNRKKENLFVTLTGNSRVLLAGCPNHAYDDTAQMQIFCNALKPSTRIILDATTGGSLNYKTASEAQKIIEIMESSEQMMLYDRGGGSKSGMLELNVLDVGLAQGKLLPKQIEDVIAAEIKKGMAALKILPQVAPIKLLKHIGCDFCGGAHKNGACEAPDEDDTEELEEGRSQGQQGAQPYQAPPQKVAWGSVLEKLVTSTSSFIEESRAIQKNHSTSIKNLETQLVQLAQKMAQRTPGNLPSDTFPNPRNNVNAVTTRSGKVSEQVPPKAKQSGSTPTSTHLEEMVTLASFEEHAALEKEEELVRKLPPKLKDPGSFSIPCAIGNRTFEKALCDLGDSVSLMPLSIYKKLGLEESKTRN
ncbi:uncharacterized protein [Cicer arietinum]|uniref:uncharacterized protein n=1 Tax=Cicer arietinum TaxID=3827 RepID=UPI00032A8258